MRKPSPRSRTGKLSAAPIGKPYAPPIGKLYAPPIKVAKGGKVPVTARALIQRINRVLRKQDEMVKAPRGARARAELGDYYTLDFRLNAIVHKYVDLETLGRQVGALQDFEMLEVQP